MRIQELSVHCLFVVCGLLMVFRIIPAHTGDPLPTGLSPDTLPNVLCWLIIAISGLKILKALKSGIIRDGKAQIDAGVLVHAVKYFALMALVFPAWKYLGFLAGSMLLLAVLLVAAGEKKPLPIAATSALVVLLVYCAVVYVLNVPLPYK